jgi:hypothetical protein
MAPNRNARDKLITALKRDILDYLREMDATGDVDLWQEAAAKLCDVLLVYRRKGRSVPPEPSPPETFTFSDGVTRDLDVMAYSHALEEINEELDEASQWPAWMMRGENHA